MNYKDRIVGIENKDHLEEAAAYTAAPYQPFVVLDPARIRPSSVTDSHLGLFRRNPVLVDMFDVPVVPTEVPDLIMQ